MAAEERSIEITSTFTGGDATTAALRAQKVAIDELIASTERLVNTQRRVPTGSGGSIPFIGGEGAQAKRSPQQVYQDVLQEATASGLPPATATQAARQAVATGAEVGIARAGGAKAVFSGATAAAPGPVTNTGLPQWVQASASPRPLTPWEKGQGGYFAPAGQRGVTGPSPFGPAPPPGGPQGNVMGGPMPTGAAAINQLRPLLLGLFGVSSIAGAAALVVRESLQAVGLATTFTQEAQGYAGALGLGMGGGTDMAQAAMNAAINAPENFNQTVGAQLGLTQEAAANPMLPGGVDPVAAGHMADAMTAINTIAEVTPGPGGPDKTAQLFQQVLAQGEQPGQPMKSIPGPTVAALTQYMPGYGDVLQKELAAQGVTSIAGQPVTSGDQLMQLMTEGAALSPDTFAQSLPLYANDPHVQAEKKLRDQSFPNQLGLAKNKALNGLMAGVGLPLENAALPILQDFNTPTLGGTLSASSSVASGALRISSDVALGPMGVLTDLAAQRLGNGTNLQGLGLRSKAASGVSDVAEMALQWKQLLDASGPLATDLQTLDAWTSALGTDFSNLGTSVNNLWTWITGHIPGAGGRNSGGGGPPGGVGPPPPPGFSSGGGGGLGGAVSGALSGAASGFAQGGIPGAIVGAGTGAVQGAQGTGPGAPTSASGPYPYDALTTQYGGAYANDPVFHQIVAAGAMAESGWDPTAVQPGGGAQGLFQFDPNGMGSGLSQAQLNDPNYEASQIVPAYAAAYQRGVALGLTGADLASYVAVNAEHPADSGGPGNTQNQSYRNAYNSLTPGTAPSDESGQSTDTGDTMGAMIPTSVDTGSGASNLAAANIHLHGDINTTIQHTGDLGTPEALDAHAEALLPHIANKLAAAKEQIVGGMVATA